MDFRGEGGGFEAEQRSRAIGAVDFAAGLGEGVEDKSAFVLFEIVERGRCGVGQGVSFARRAD